MIRGLLGEWSVQAAKPPIHTVHPRTLQSVRPGFVQLWLRKTGTLWGDTHFRTFRGTNNHSPYRHMLPQMRKPLGMLGAPYVALNICWLIGSNTKHLLVIAISSPACLPTTG